MRLSVTILTPGTYPIPSNVTSSVETSVMQTAPFLAEKMSVTVLGRKQDNVPYHVEKDGVKYINFRAKNTKEYLGKAIQYMIHHPTSIVHVENRPGYIRQLKDRIPGVKVSLMLHSITFLKSSLMAPGELLYALQSVDKIIVNSQFMKNYITQIDHNLMEKTYVNYLGVDLDNITPRYTPGNVRLREKKVNELGISNKKIILYVGRLRKIKGVHRLLKSLSLLRPHVKDFILIIVGGSRCGKNKKTKYVRRLHRQAAKYPGQVFFVSYVPSHQIQTWYVLADVVVVPSVCQEAFGLVNVEAMATAVPVIASNTGGIPEVIQHEKNGLLVPLDHHVQGLADALFRILSDEEFANKLGQEGRKQVEQQWTWQHTAHRLYHYLKT